MVDSFCQVGAKHQHIGEKREFCACRRLPNLRFRITPHHRHQALNSFHSLLGSFRTIFNIASTDRDCFQDSPEDSPPYETPNDTNYLLRIALVLSQLQNSLKDNFLKSPSPVASLRDFVVSPVRNVNKIDKCTNIENACKTCGPFL